MSNNLSIKEVKSIAGIRYVRHGNFYVRNINKFILLICVAVGLVMLLDMIDNKDGTSLSYYNEDKEYLTANINNGNVSINDEDNNIILELGDKYLISQNIKYIADKDSAVIGNGLLLESIIGYIVFGLVILIIIIHYMYYDKPKKRYLKQFVEHYNNTGELMN